MIKRLIVAISIAYLVANPAFAGNKMRVAFLNVGQGDATVITFPNGKHVMIDAAPSATKGVLPFLHAKGIKELEAIVVTHPHLDHMGGVAELIEKLKVKKVYDSGKKTTTKTYLKMLKTISKHGVPYAQPRAGEKIVWDTSVTVRVVHPNRADYKDVNDNSVSLHIQYGDISFLFTGDSEKEAEHVMTKRFGSSLKSTVLQVGHHGSHSSSTKPFIRAVQPKYAVISCGLGNSFRHPRQVTLDTLKQAKAKVYRTDLHGYITMVTDGKKLKIRKQLMPFRTVKLSKLDSTLIPFKTKGWSENRSRKKRGMQRGITFIGKGVKLTAKGGENIWKGRLTAPYYLRNIPESMSWAYTTKFDMHTNRRTEAGMMLLIGEKRCITFGITPKNKIVIGGFDGPKMFYGPATFIAPANRIGIQTTGGNINFIAYDKGDGNWKQLWSISRRELGVKSSKEKVKIGLYSKSWGKDEGVATFKDFYEYKNSKPQKKRRKQENDK